MNARKQRTRRPSLSRGTQNVESGGGMVYVSRRSYHGLAVIALNDNVTIKGVADQAISEYIARRLAG